MRKEQKANNKVCPYCGKVFVQKTKNEKETKS